MKLHHLRDFIAIARAQSVRGAARDLGLTQPALTRSLGELERELGAVLLERHARGVVLTAVGDAFLVRARAALEEIRRGGDEVAQLRGEATGAVTVGLSGTAWLALAPEVFTAFKRAYPDVRLRLVEGFFGTLEAQLRNGTMDFYVGPLPGTPLSDAYRTLPLFEKDVVIVGRVDHPLRNAKSLRALLDAEWVVTGVRERPEAEFERVFTERGLAPPTRTTRVDASIGVAVLLSETDALAVLPVQWMQTRLFKHALAAIPVKERFTAPGIVQIARAGLPLTPAAEHLSVLLQRAAQAYAARGGNVAARSTRRPRA